MDDTQPYVKITVIVETDGKQITTTFDKTLEANWETRWSDPDFMGPFGMARTFGSTLEEMTLTFKPFPNEEGVLYTSAEGVVDG